MAATLVDLWHFPVKSLPAAHLSEAELVPGRGLPGDREWALSTGSHPVADDGTWTSCTAFERLTIRPEMAGWMVHLDDAHPTVRGPEGTTLRFGDDGHPEGEVSGPFSPAIRLHRAVQGYWDHADAALSILNLDTVEEIARLTGKAIDPARFRANLHVRADPWSEFGWLCECRA